MVQANYLFPSAEIIADSTELAKFAKDNTCMTWFNKVLEQKINLLENVFKNNEAFVKKYYKSKISQIIREAYHISLVTAVRKQISDQKRRMKKVNYENAQKIVQAI